MCVDEVVISGMSGRLPESDTIDEFKEHLMNNEDMITDDGRRWTPGMISWFTFHDQGVKIRFPFSIENNFITFQYLIYLEFVNL